MRRSGGVSKILLMKKLKLKVYVSFLISLYMLNSEHLSLVNKIVTKPSSLLPESSVSLRVIIN